MAWQCVNHKINVDGSRQVILQRWDNSSEIMFNVLQYIVEEQNMAVHQLANVELDSSNGALSDE